MNENQWLLLTVSFLGLVALAGFFCTKTKGFGPHATSALLLMVVLIFSALLFTAGKLGAESVGNIFFAVIGFAGGLFTTKDPAPPSLNRQKNENNAEKLD
jgi:hypothetical protein